MTTVLVLNPMGTDVTPLVAGPFLGIKPLMQGSIGALGTVENVPYTNLAGIDNIIGGTATLHARLTTGRAPGETFVVFGYSEGCQVASRWLRLHGPDLDIDPADIEFILIGNASRKYGGFIYQRDVFAALADIEGYPDDTPYTITDFCRQYDSVADVPTATPIIDALESLVGLTSDLSYLDDALRSISTILAGQHYIDAVLNALAGSALVHQWYFDVTLTDKNLVKKVEGNVTYLWSPTDVLPILAGWWWLPQYQQQLDRQQRPPIETTYSRPVTIPSPTYNLLAPPPPPRPPGPLDLAGPDIKRIAAVADKLAEEEQQSLDDDWIITVYDKLWRPVGAMGDDMMELTGTDARNNVSSATMKITGKSELWETFQSCKTTLVGLTVETQGLRFAFYVDSFDQEYTEKGERFGTVHLLGIYDILNYYTIFPLWWLPIQTQPFSHAVFIWALATLIENMIAECAQRIQSGIMGFVNNALSLNPDMRAWVGQFLQSNGNIFQMLKTPLYVVRNDPLLDTSPLVARTVRMESCGTVIADITKAYGVDVRVDLWLPGDDQPDVWANLDQPTYVVTVKDRSQIEGPTKTVLDSVIRQVVDLGGSLGNVLAPIIQQVPGMRGVFHAPLLGVKYVAPWAIAVAPEPGEKGSVVSCKISDHTPKGYVHIIGGRSPKWLNDLMNAFFAWMIDSISILIGFTGIPSNLLEGFMNNTLLAFQQVELYDRHNDVGPYHPNVEVMHPTASSPYNIETLFAFITAAFDSAGYTSAMATFRNGEVYTLGKDVFRGGLMSIVYDGRTKLFTDYIELVMFRITPTARDVLIQIGDGKKEAPPLAKIQALVTGLFESFSVLTLAPQS